jgi:hypothetical protein
MIFKWNEASLSLNLKGDSFVLTNVSSSIDDGAL